MTAGIKQMLAEKAKAAEDEAAALALEQKWDEIDKEIMAMIDRAAPFMDEGSDPNKWSPSARLKIAYCVMGTSRADGAGKRASRFVLDMIARARELWTDGAKPDPWQPVTDGGEAGCPFCTDRSSYTGNPANSFCDKHYRQYLLTYQIEPEDLASYRAKSITQKETP